MQFYLYKPNWSYVKQLALVTVNFYRAKFNSSIELQGPWSSSFYLLAVAVNIGEVNNFLKKLKITSPHSQHLLQGDNAFSWTVNLVIFGRDSVNWG